MRTASRLDPETSTSGSGDILDDLERDHRVVDGLFAQASLATGEARATAVRGIVDALSAHAAVEEEVVYPALEAAVPGGDALADRARHEHQDIEDLLAELEALDADDPGAEAVLRRLQLVVQAHVAVEEGELWPAYRMNVEPAVLAELGGAR